VTSKPSRGTGRTQRWRVPGLGCAGVGVAGRRRPPDRCPSPRAYESDCRSADAATCATTAHRL